jgi:hypothetical protein
MFPMRNRHSGLVSMGLHKLKEEMRAEKYKPVYKNGWWMLEK